MTSYKVVGVIGGLDGIHPVSDPCLVILVNPQGCTARFGRPLEIGTLVQLEGLPARNRAYARVVNCISVKDHKPLWLLGLELNEAGNVWGIQSPPKDWTRS